MCSKGIKADTIGDIFLVLVYPFGSNQLKPSANPFDKLLQTAFSTASTSFLTL